MLKRIQDSEHHVAKFFSGQQRFGDSEGVSGEEVARAPQPPQPMTKVLREGNTFLLMAL